MGPAVLFVPGVAASIHFVPWERTVSGRPLLEACLSRLRSTFAGEPMILVHEGTASDAVRQAARAYDCGLVPRAGRSEIAVLAAIADHMGADLLLSGRLEMSLVPRRVLARHWEWHREQQRAYSTITGVSDRVSAEIVSATALGVLAGLQVPGAPSSLRPFVQAIERSGGMAQLGLAISTGYLEARSVLPWDNGALPCDVAFDTPADVECAAAALSVSDGQEDEDWAALRAWKRRRIEQVNASWKHRQSPPRSPATVLFVSNPSACSGAEESLCQVVRHLDRRRYVPAAMVALDGEFTDRLRAAGSDVHVPNHDFGRDSVDSYGALAATIDRYRPDVIHVNAPSGMPLIYAAWERGIPIVAHVRQADLQGWTPLLQASQKILCVSRYIRDRVIQLDVEPCRAEVVYDGVDPARFFPGVVSRASARESLGLPPDVPVLLCVARYARTKRLDLFCRAVAAVREERGPIRAVIVGDPQTGPDVAADITRLIEDLGLTDVVSRFAFQQDLRCALAAADVIVLCSEQEPLGTCILEAFAMGVPAVVTRSGGLAELIEPHDAAVLVPPGAVDALSQGIAQVLRSADFRERICRGGRHVIASQCNSAAAAARTMDVFDAAVASAVTV